MTTTHDLLTPGEVARIFRVDPKTVTRWGNTGRLRSIRTPGGHRRFIADDVFALIAGDTGEAEGPVCFKCRGTAGEVVDRGKGYGDQRYMHAYGKCPS